MSIRFTQGFIQERLWGDVTRKVFRGILHPDSLGALQSADYQRQVLTGSIAALKTPLASGMIPDIQLGCRGLRYQQREGGYYFQDEIFIIDGKQRHAEALVMLEKDPGNAPELGCVMWLDTTYDWERLYFIDLNTTGTSLSPSVVIRDMAPDYPVIQATVDVTQDKKSNFILKHRVTWDQRALKKELVPGRLLLKAWCHLHSHLGPGKGTSPKELANGAQFIANRIGVKQFIENGVEFINLVDWCWDLQHIEQRSRSPQVKGAFLFAIAELLCTFPHEFFVHANVTAEKNEPHMRSKLLVPMNRKRKLRTFPIQDQSNVVLTTGGVQKGMEELYARILRHLNSGVRSKRLVDPRATKLAPAEDEPNGTGEEEGDDGEE